jgi:5-methylcytosine-specific restriction endonuclease McrA
MLCSPHSNIARSGANCEPRSQSPQLPLYRDNLMPADKVFADVHAFVAELRELRADRRSRVIAGRAERPPRRALPPAARTAVFNKTGGRCHICGGLIDGHDWDADHVMARSTGGSHEVDNYLPAHSICNSYRWHFGSDEFQWILKLGVWVRTQIANQTPLGLVIAKRFCEYDRRRAGAP